MDRKPVAFTEAMAATRGMLGEPREQLIALQDDITTVTDAREPAVEICHQVQRSITDLEGQGGSEKDRPGTPVQWEDEIYDFTPWRNLSTR